MHSRHDHDVIIVGAGPVGLVTAWLLAEAGVDALVVEAQADVSDDLRASTFHPPTLDMLAPHGVTEALLAAGLRCPHWQVRDHATGERAVFDLGLLAGDTDHPFRLQCEQAHLTRLLADRLAGRAGLRFGNRVTDLSEADDAVTVTMRDVASGAAATARARYLIGADGAGSTVRQALGIDFPGMTYAETTVLVTTPFEFQRHIEDLSNVSYCWSEQGNFALLRLPGCWRASLYYEPSLGPRAALSERRVQAQLHAICPADEPFVIIDRRAYHVHQRLVANYRRGRVLLAGDAAHVNAPSGGMGMNGGIHDAFALAEALARRLDGASESVLDRYTRRRRPVAERDILAGSDRNRRRMTDRDPARRAAALHELQAIAGDARRAREHLLRTSMISGLQAAAAVR